jgi:hypothetical protein
MKIDLLFCLFMMGIKLDFKSKLFFLSAFLILSSGILFAQDINLRTFDYSKADSIALSFPKGKFITYKEIVNPLTENLKTEQEKFRAIYRWIADNVTYSLSNKSENPGKTLTSRKATCIGYSTLLKEMCNYAGLECNVIGGLSKNKPEDIPPASEDTRHAWNEVKLNGKWYLTDITWASGTFDFTKKTFHKNFDTAYFLPTPEFFIKQHFPTDIKMQMLSTPAKKTVFIKSCVWYENAALYNFTVTSPDKGYVNQNVNKDFTVTIHIDKPLADKDTLHGFTFVVDDGKKDEGQENETVPSTYVMPDKFSVIVTCHFPEDLKGEHDVTIFYNQKAVFGFRMNFH